ncbi:hypothetical protein K469DRAFT_745593 [Zopfia rhizophila CBS 207.26]|uniref:Ecp2 effector protein domain-containing protein n=1 Tax=Zopfia rhizophila CBS 207.26 TaxID=1314779 RepID=A0A6A6ERD2_9PEZI|nr:hypothetical protein K469DRAFT_745593 [Zopfia rhizophila CBS 207.26]
MHVIQTLSAVLLSGLAYTTMAAPAPGANTGEDPKQVYCFGSGKTNNPWIPVGSGYGWRVWIPQPIGLSDGRSCGDNFLNYLRAQSAGCATITSWECQAYQDQATGGEVVKGILTTFDTNRFCGTGQIQKAIWDATSPQLPNTCSNEGDGAPSTEDILGVIVEVFGSLVEGLKRAREEAADDVSTLTGLDSRDFDDVTLARNDPHHLIGIPQPKRRRPREVIELWNYALEEPPEEQPARLPTASTIPFAFFMEPPVPFTLRGLEAFGLRMRFDGVGGDNVDRTTGWLVIAHHTPFRTDRLLIDAVITPFGIVKGVIPQPGNWWWLWKRNWSNLKEPHTGE